MKKNVVNLLAELVNTRDLPEAKSIIRELEEKHDFGWRPVGDREANYGNIAMGSDRVTHSLRGLPTPSMR